MALLGPTHGTGICDKEGKQQIDPVKGTKKISNDTVLKKLFRELGPRYADRPGGYTRIIKQHYRRLGDAGATAVIELLKAGEKKVRMVEREPAPVPAPAPGCAGSGRTRTARRAPRPQRPESSRRSRHTQCACYVHPSRRDRNIPPNVTSSSASPGYLVPSPACARPSEPISERYSAIGSPGGKGSRHDVAPNEYRGSHHAGGGDRGGPDRARRGAV